MERKMNQLVLCLELRFLLSGKINPMDLKLIV